MSNARTPRPAARWASLMTAAALVAAAGCESNKDNRSTRSTSRSGSNATVRTASQTGSSTTRTAAATRGMRESSATLDNVLRITKHLPQEVIAGTPFEYQVTVENTSDNLMLHNVWIREHAGMSHSQGGQTALHGGMQHNVQTTGLSSQPAGMQHGHTTSKVQTTSTTTRRDFETGPDRDITLDNRDQLDQRQDPTRPDIRTTGYEQRQGIPTPGPGGAEQSQQPGDLNRDVNNLNRDLDRDINRDTDVDVNLNRDRTVDLDANRVDRDTDIDVDIDRDRDMDRDVDVDVDLNRDLDRTDPDTDLSREIRDEQRDLSRELRETARQGELERRDSGGVITQSEIARQPADSGQRDAFGDPYQRPRQDPSRPDIRTTGFEQRQGIPTPGPGGADQSNQPGDLDRDVRFQQTGFQQRTTTTTQQVGGQGWDNRWNNQQNVDQDRFNQDRNFRPVGTGAMGMGQESGPSNDYFVGDLGPGESRTITVSSVAPGAGQQMICTSAAYTPVMCMTVNAIQPFLNITKSGPEEASVGQEITWQMTVTNTGVGPAREVVITDPLPGDMRTASGDNQVRIDVGTLNAGESKTFTVSAVAPTTGRFTNIARVEAAGGLSDEAQASTNVRQARLEIEKRGPEVEYTNIGADFEIAVTNTGDAPAQNVVLEDMIPRGARFLEASSSGTAAQDRVSWNLGTIPPGETRTVLVRMAGTQAGTLENCAMVSAMGIEPVRDCATVRFEGVAALLLEVVDVEDPIRVGGRTAYDIVVTNQGTAEATNIAVDFELDERTSLQNAEGPSPFGQTDTGASFRPIASLAAGQRATFRVFVNAQAAGDTRFRVNMRADQLTRPVVETESTRIVE